MSSRVAVVGGGIFGVACAAALARRGHPVTLYEASADILGAASGINQYRLHRGYHYPRSEETATASRDSEVSFRNVYGRAVLTRSEHYYAIAREQSLTGGDEFVSFLDRMRLPYGVVRPDWVDERNVELTVAVEESLFDPLMLRALAWEQLRETGVSVELRRRVRAAELDEYATVVVATYAELNNVLEGVDGTREYQFEVVEKPLVRPPASLAGKSVVVLDGPFACIDPYGESGLSVMGHVVHAIHYSSVGRHPEVPEEIAPLLNRGVVERPPVTNFPRFAEATAAFVPDVAAAEHVGSMFTIRTVLPGLDATDARPTIVGRVSDRVITVFSGKIVTCVRAAEDVVAMIDEDRAPTAAL
jgi:hypothetical protein